MKMSEMRRLCGDQINLEERWGRGFLVSAKSSEIIRNKLEPMGFTVKGIGIGYDYNRGVYTLYAEADHKDQEEAAC